jgi:multimeric flavodoxin WrbA
MKTLIFNGSPRKNGSTAFLVNELVRHLEGESRIIRAYETDISPCIDCRYCWQHTACAIKDGMQELYSQIIDADHIVIASSLNFGEITGKLLCILSRLQMFYSARKFQHIRLIEKKKRGAVILCGGGDGGAPTAERTARLILKEMNAELTDVITSLQTDRLPGREDKEAIGRVRALAKRLNEPE